MTKTKAVALFVAVVGSLLYLKTVFFPPAMDWKDLNNAGLIAYEAKDFAKAEKLLMSALEEAEKFALDDTRLTLSLNNLAELHRLQDNHDDAEPYIKRALENAEKIYGPDHSNVAAHLNNLAGNYRARGMNVEAEPFAKRALDIWEKTLGPDNALVLFALEGYVDLLRKLGRDAEAESYLARLKPGQDNHPKVNPGNGF